MINSGAIMDAALLLNEAEYDNPTNDALSTTYEMVFDTIKVKNYYCCLFRVSNLFIGTYYNNYIYIFF